MPDYELQNKCKCGTRYEAEEADRGGLSRIYLSSHFDCLRRITHVGQIFLKGGMTSEPNTRQKNLHFLAGVTLLLLSKNMKLPKEKVNDTFLRIFGS